MVSLNLLGAASLLLYALLAGALRASNAARDVVAFLAVVAALFALMLWAWQRASAPAARGRTAARILLFAALFRLVMLGTGLPREQRWRALERDLGGVRTGYQTFLLYDNDVWRYLWDGHLTATGIGPYAKTPHELLSEVEDLDRPGDEPDPPPLESDLWWDVLDNVSFRTYTSVYPPLAQALFATAHRLAPGSVLVLKLLLALVDFGCCLAVLALLRAVGRPDRDLVLYAWNPLIVKEFAGSGHVDTLMVLFVTWGAVALIRRRGALAQILLGVAIASKLGALILLPLFCRRTRPVTWGLAPLAALAVSMPFWSGIGGLWRGLGTYAREWIFNSGPWVALARLLGAFGLEAPDLWAHLLTKAVVVVLVLRALRPGPFEAAAWIRSCFWVLASLVVLNPAVMPWYLAWALPFAVAAGYRSWTVFTGLAFLSYLFYVDQGAASWWLWLEYGALFAYAAWEGLRRSRTASASATLSG